VSAGELADVRAIVAGGASGIGRRLVAVLASSGAQVNIFDRDAGMARESAVEASSSSGPEVGSTEVDITDRSSLAAAVDAFAADGGLNTVVNCVGVNRFQVLDEVSEQDWNDLVAINLTGAWNVASTVTPHLRRAGVGSIVLISSVAGMLGIPKAIPYTSAKHGVIGLTRALALDLGPSGITVNAICPGVISTPLLARATTETFRSQATERTPMRRLGTPLDIANAVAFLVSAKARWITGAVLPVDGGLTCGIRSTHWE
jgi:NAD(P)-dependent dehydrogenase (short-subunit alcohol dehydrogenase family)